MLITSWALTQEKLDKVIDLAAEIINEKTTILLTKSEQDSSLFDDELTVLLNKNMDEFPSDMDRWLSLVLGNILYTDIEQKLFFNEKVVNAENFFTMIKNWNYSNSASAPIWAREYFMGIQLNLEQYLMHSNLSFIEIDFSYSKLQNLNLNRAFLYKTNFNNCSFDSVSMNSADVRKATFNNISIKNGLDIAFSTLGQYLFVPPRLADILSDMNNDNSGMGTYTVEGDKIILLAGVTPEHNQEIFNILKGFFLLCLNEKELAIEEIHQLFKYEDDETRENFTEWIDALSEEI